MQDINLSPEEKLLVSLCRVNFNNERTAGINGLVNEVTDWSNFTTAANEHGIIALVHKNFNILCLSEAVPEYARDMMRSGYLKNLARNTLIGEIAVEIADIAREENIRIVLLKGLALEKTLYGNEGLRQMTDIDILVSPGDAKKLRSILQIRGYGAAPFISRIYEKYLYVEGKHLPEMTKMGIPVEIHFRLFDEQANLLTNELFGSSLPLPGESSLFSPGLQLHFLYLVKHLHKHEQEGSSQLRLYADLVIMLESYSELILNERLFQHARSANMEQALIEKLGVLEKFWGLTIPASLKTETDEAVIRKFTSFLKNPVKNARETINPLKPLKYIPGAWNKFLFITGFVFPSEKFLRYKYKPGKNDHLLFLYLDWWKGILQKLIQSVRS